VKPFDSAIDDQDAREARSLPDGASGSLFSAQPARGRKARNSRSPELTAARVLCRQLARKRVSAEKKRIVHLICLNLLAILKRRSQEA
jgi:hypothetical protein